VPLSLQPTVADELWVTKSVSSSVLSEVSVSTGPRTGTPVFSSREAEEENARRTALGGKYCAGGGYIPLTRAA
jgi:hypothetical protein